MKEILTPRQHEIADLLAWGASAKEIALILQLSVHTVVLHIKNIKRKLGINKITEISAYIFCTDYEVPVSYDKIGNIKKVISMYIFLILIGLAEFQQMDCLRISTTRIMRSRTVSRKGKRQEEGNCFEYDTALG